jgi:hypothetical protein
MIQKHFTLFDPEKNGNRPISEHDTTTTDKFVKRRKKGRRRRRGREGMCVLSHMYCMCEVINGSA